MHLSKLFNEKNVVCSFEIFPPNKNSSIDTILNTLEELKDLSPDFISVTYGAGGSLQDNKTCELSSLVKNKYGIETLAHLTCVNSTGYEIDSILKRLKDNNVENILALRGDVNKESLNSYEYRHATDIIKHIRKDDYFQVSAACYPEGHLEAESLDLDIAYLKDKVNFGAEHLISQLFFDNNLFYNFMDKINKEKIDVPIQAGIMPVINANQIKRILSLCGATFPEKFKKIINKYEHDKVALRDAGIAYAVEQIVDLVSSGVDGIHLYTMNNPYVAKKIVESTKSIINFSNKKCS